jgi:leader peptidase (prepilin peptidase)/N-methyltransferase
VIEASVLALLFGLLVGSFLNVCIYRWPRDLSVVRPRSHCTACDAMIVWYDNIPLVSYALLAGRCRHCKARISARYPIVEFATGALFLYFVSTMGVTLMAAKLCCFSAMLLALICSDLEERILPDEFTLGGALVGIAFAVFVPVTDPAISLAPALLWPFGITPVGRWIGISESLAGALVPSLALWFGGWVYWKVRHREGLGFGDVKLVAMIGSFLGLQGALWTLIVGSVAGSILGYGYIKLSHQDPDTYELPFGTFLGGAALLAAILSKSLLGT